MKRLLALFVVLSLSACAGTPISEFTHKDLQNAQKIAATPERAAVWKAVEAQVTALETANAAIAAQAKACADALKAGISLPDPSGGFGLATLIEVEAGAVSKGPSAAVKANCEPVPLPSIIGLPKLPIKFP